MKKIFFSDKLGLTQAVLDGRKTMTRRIFYIPDKFVPYLYIYDIFDIVDDCIIWKDKSDNIRMTFEPKYKVGEVVAIAQSYESVYHECGLETMDMLVSKLKYSVGWTNKMFVKADLMPHHIKITDIKVERLQDISDEDCLKYGIYEDSGDDEFPPSIFYEFEGNKDDGFDTPREAFASLIDKVSGKGVFQSNPYVFVYEFKLLD